MLLCIAFNIMGPSFTPMMTSRAETEIGYKWEKNDTLDELLKIVSNKAGDDEIFLKWDLDDYGSYQLEYYMKDQIRTTVMFEYMVDELKVKYFLDDMTTGSPVSITQGEVDKSYAEMNYELLVPKLETVAKTVTSGAVEFVVERGASSMYPGSSFSINNVDVRFKWDIQSNTLYFLSKGLPKGHIVPCQLTVPSGKVETIELLRSLAEFKVTPTHWIPKSDGTNENITSLNIPTSVADYVNEKPGNRPGLRINFQQPKIFNEITRQYEIAAAQLNSIGAVIDLSEIGSTDYTDFKMKLNAQDDNIIDAPLSSTVNDNVEYKYDMVTGLYTIEIVKDKSTLHQEDTDFMQWNDLDASKIYNVNVIFDESPNYEFDNYQPENKYGYTYLSYEIKRASIEDAYLEIVPYSGSNEDELEYTIYYSKSLKSEFGEDDIWLKHYHSSDYSDTNIYIPVPFNNGSTQEFYQVGVEFAGSPLRSQVIKYIPVDDENIPPPVPKIDSITNLAVVPPTNALSNEPSKVQFDLFWQAPRNDTDNPMLDDMLDNGDIYYELLMNDVASDTLDNSYKVIKVFKVSKDSGDIVVTEVNTGMPLADGFAINNYTNGYNKNENLFAVSDVVIKDSTGWSNIPDIQSSFSPIQYTVLPGVTSYDYEFPGINFLRMRSVYVSNDGLGFSDKSIPESLSLSMISLDVPIVDHLGYQPKTVEEKTDPIAVDVSWKAIDIDNYNDQMLYPINLELQKIVYGVYITQDKNKLKDLDKQDIKDADDHSTYDQLTYGSERVQLTDSELRDLRQGDVMFFEVPTFSSQKGDISVDIENLDPNTNYFVRVVTKLEVKDKITAAESRKYSEPSNMISMTSPVIPTEPGEDEKIPIAPEEVIVEFAEENSTKTILTWTYPEAIEFAEDTYGFEIFSIENRSMPTSLDSRETKVEDIVESSLLTEPVEAWRLYVEDGTAKLVKYNEMTQEWLEASETFEVGTNKITLTDTSNNTNKVIYYYVRTVRIQNKVVLQASTWVADTITTSPIAAPINLTVAYEPYTYDAKTESIIRFDAPIPRGSDISNNYIMEIYIKSDDDIDYTYDEYTTSFIEEVDGAKDGYSRLYYRISDLDPGKSYSIKVRVVDKTKEPESLPDGLLVYPTSSFTDSVVTRTDFDQVTHDIENKYKQYIDFYLKQAETLKHVSFWQLDGDDKHFIVKYREANMEGQLTQASNTQFDLMGEENYSLTYYLPHEVIDEANNNEVTLCIKNGETQVGIRPFTINIRTTKQISDIVKKIKAYDSNLEDYFIRVTLHKGQYHELVNGKKPVSDLVNLEIQVVGSTGTESYIEERILTELDAEINDHKVTLMDKLEEELENGINDERLLEIVNETLDEVKEDHRREVTILMDRYIKDDYSMIEKLEVPLYLATTLDDDDILQAQAFKKESHGFTEVVTTFSNGRYLLDLDQPGSYIFTQKSISFDDLDGAYSGLTTDVVSQYDLLDIFSRDEIKSETQVAYKYQIIASAARLLGAKKGQDDNSWLAKNGITLLNGGSYNSITREEALYIFVKTYGKKYDIQLESVRIHDYALIEDYHAIHESYKSILLIGANLGLIPISDGLLKPTQNMTVEEALDLITRVENNIDW